MNENSKENKEPKFCFVCGGKLEKLNMGWYQCENEKCNEMFFPFIDINSGNQCVMLQTTP